MLSEQPDDLVFVDEFEVRGREAKMRIYSIPDPGVPRSLRGPLCKPPAGTRRGESLISGSMTWGTVFVVFFVSHQAGDYLLQTNWQAMHKRGGLGRDPVARRALLSHTFTYSCAYVPAFIWISSELGWTTLVIAAAVSLPHLIQDDTRLLMLYTAGSRDSIRSRTTRSRRSSTRRAT